MEKQTRSMLALVAVSLLAAMLPSSEAAYSGDGLSKDYYSSSCPKLLSFVGEEVTRKKNETVVTIPAVLRLFFHDCFVNVSSLPILHLRSEHFLLCLLNPSYAVLFEDYSMPPVGSSY
jgi:peroxidase